MKSKRTKLIQKADALIRERVRERDKVCQKCGSPQASQPSHVYSRNDKRIRWDENNILWMCYFCHIQWWHREPMEAHEWFKAKFPDRWKYLQKKRKELSKPIGIKELESL